MNKIKPKRSFTPNSVPLTTDLTEVGELAINWADGIAYTRNSAGQIVSVKLGGGGGGGGSANIVEAATPSAFPATGSSGTLYIATDVSRIYRWSGSVYVEIGTSGGGGSGSDDPRWVYFKPGAPTSVTASAGNAQATVTWTAPTGVIAQAPITDYTVQFQPSGGSWQTFSDGTSTATSATVTGLTNGTAYQFRVAAVNAVGTGSYSAASSAVTVGAPTDPYFSNVSLLLHADGSGSTFVDSSPTPKTITAVGATQSTTEFKFGGKSAFFNGSSDYLSSPISSAYEFGTGDFCVEAWLYPTSFNDFYRIVGIGVGAAGGGPFSGWNVRLTQTAGKLSFFRYDGGVAEFSSTASLSLNQWNYVAVARASGVLRLYVNGNESGTFSATGAFDRVDNGNLYIGSTVIYNANTTIYYAGYLDDIRITKGSARGYTGATITVPTASFPDS